MSVVRSLIVAALLAGLCGCNSPPRAARYRFVVEIDDNGRIARGSSVQEERCAFHDGYIRMGNAFDCGERGEAVVVDLGAKGLLFVLLNPDPSRPRVSGSPWGLLEEAHQKLYDPGGLSAAAFDRMAASRDIASFAAEQMPMMVRFRDVGDPKSVELVDPAHLDASFGPGIEFSKATVAITDDPVTTGIETLLPWLPGLKGVHPETGKIPWTLEGSILQHPFGDPKHTLAGYLEPGYFKD